MTVEMLKVVFDCGVFLQGLISRSGPAVACLELIEQKKSSSSSAKKLSPKLKMFSHVRAYEQKILT